MRTIDIPDFKLFNIIIVITSNYLKCNYGGENEYARLLID